MVELAASAKALSIPYHNFNDYLRASGLLLLKGTGNNSNKTEAQGSNIMSIDFFKREAKNFLKDWQTQTITTNADGSNSYHYDWKFYDVDYHFNKLKLDDKDRLDIKLARSQHWLAQILGQKNWNVLISLTDFELSQMEELLRNIKNQTDSAKTAQTVQVIPCFRVRSQFEMTFRDKDLFSKAFKQIIKAIKESVKDSEFWEDHFDFWDTFKDNGGFYTYVDRQEYLIKKLKNIKTSYAQLIIKVYNKFRDGRMYIGCYCPVVITELIGQLGIRVYKTNFGTDKISGFCTKLMDRKYGSEIEVPVIVINEVYCNTPERYLKEVAKQFYYMISKPDEFDYLEENGIRFEMHSTQKEAEAFAEEIFISTEYVNLWLKRFGEQGQKFSPELTRNEKDFFLRNYEMEHIVNRIKGDFYVDYRTAIKKLLESDWPYKFMFDDYKEAEAFYLECLKRHNENYADKIKWTNDEPESLPWDYTNFITRKQYIM